MTVEIIPEESGERENLLKRLSELVRKEIKFDPESKTRTVQDVMQRMHEKGLFKEKAFGSKLKDDLIKNLMVRQPATNAPEEKPGTTLGASCSFMIHSNKAVIDAYFIMFSVIFYETK